MKKVTKKNAVKNLKATKLKTVVGAGPGGGPRQGLYS